MHLDKGKSVLQLPKIKGIKIKLHRFFEGKIKTITITKTPSEKYYASILVEEATTIAGYRLVVGACHKHARIFYVMPSTLFPLGCDYDLQVLLWQDTIHIAFFIK